jgi:hypothetical protein
MSTVVLLRRFAIIGAPLGLATLAAIHPIVADALIPADKLGVWNLIHTMQLPLVALLGVGMLLTVDRLEGPEARTARLAVVPWAVAFAAFDAIAGLGAGALSTYGDSHPEDVTTALGIAATLADSVFVSAVLPLTALVFALFAFGGAAIALHRAGAPGLAAFAIGAGGITWTFIHPLVGAPAMVVFLAGAVMVERSSPAMSGARAATPTRATI